ncbi:MAG: UDP-glucose/GDP-mannose dehydrogenase family protein [Alphaproteobacteria bacterium]|nr:UDP-glucose/GDP-mannose dehydrogenase family protein [Alphaproteobacteria bacterium]
MRIGVIGTGYVGLVTGTCLAEMGNDVVCQDVDVDKIALLQGGGLPIYEPGLAELVARNVRDGRLVFTTAPAQVVQGMDVVFVAVGTPPGPEGAADTSRVLAAARAIGDHVDGPLVVAVKSTVPVGTCDEVQALLDAAAAARGSGHAVEVVSNPEFLKEGKAVEDFMRPDRIVLGAPEGRGREVLGALYAPFMLNGHPVLHMSIRSAELAKYAANVMLAARISLMNELARVSEAVGADIMDVRRGVGSDKRIGMAFLYAGVGYGGSCFPKDVRAMASMARAVGAHADLLDAVDAVNERQKVVLAERIVARFGGDLDGRRVAVWGLAYKPETADVREGPALAIVARLLAAGAEVVGYDPKAMAEARRALGEPVGFSLAPGPYEAARGADCLVLVTEWRVFRGLDLARVARSMRQPILFDGRNQYDPEAMQAVGLEYHCIGRGTP